MADYDSRSESGSPQRILASELNPRLETSAFPGEEEALFALHDTELRWSQGSKANRQHSGNHLKVWRSRSLNNSDTSSTSTVPTLSSAIEQSRHVDAIPQGPHANATILPWDADAMESEPSLRTYHTTFETLSGEVQDSLRSTGQSVSASETPSPRLHLNELREDRPYHAPAMPSGPLDRFLAQQDDLTGRGDDPGRLEEEWRRLRFLRANVVRLRAELRNKRKDLQEKQLAKEHADAAFMKVLREGPTGKSPHQDTHDTSRCPHHAIETCYTELQATRDECGPLQYDYNLLEDRLDEEEFELAKVEGRLYHTKAHNFSFSKLDFPVLEPSPSASRESLLGLSSDLEEYHPLYANYLSRLGDLDLAREQYQNMIQERESILSSQESRAFLGMDTSEEDHEFLSRFPELETSMKDEIAEIERDVERCRAKCVENGVDTSEDHDRDPHVINQEGQNILAADDDIILQESHPDEFNRQISMYSKLLPESVEDKSKLNTLITDFIEGNKSDRINRWILHQLRISPLEVELLVRVSLQVLSLLELYEWPKRVLFWWHRDGANIPPEEFERAPTATSMNNSLAVSRERHRPSFQEPLTKRNSPTYLPHRRTQSCPKTTSFDAISRMSAVRAFTWNGPLNVS